MISPFVLMYRAALNRARGLRREPPEKRSRLGNPLKSTIVPPAYRTKSFVQ